MNVVASSKNQIFFVKFIGEINNGKAFSLILMKAIDLTVGDH
jgi:hypothetical protein